MVGLTSLMGSCLIKLLDLTIPDWYGFLPINKHFVPQTKPEPTVPSRKLSTVPLSQALRQTVRSVTRYGSVLTVVAVQRKTLSAWRETRQRPHR
jgi:hypothetical protein